MSSIRNNIYKSLQYFSSELSKERDTLVPLLPIFTTLGIILYFRYNLKPDIRILYGITTYLVVFTLLFQKIYIKNVLLIILFITIGILASKYRINHLDSNTIHKKLDNVYVSGKIDQIIIGLEKDKIILTDLHISDTSIRKIPQKLQFKVNKLINLSDMKLKPADIIGFKANIYPLPRSIYPDAYNFADISRFKGIGGVGSVVFEENSKISAITLIKSATKTTFNSAIEHARVYIDNLIGKSMNYTDASGISMALFTGNTGYIKRETVEAIQKSGLSHLLAISGINISIVAIATFMILRKILSFSMYLSMKYDIKKIAATIALVASFFHLQISGLPISAVRSFIMFGLGLLCIFLDRPATPIRIVSFTLFIIIIQKPEGIFDPSLQMSFMAVLGLISSMGYFARCIDRRYGDGGKIMKFLLYFLGIFFSSLVSTFSTFCYSIYHFNQYSNIGLLSNLLAVPISEFGMIPVGLLGIFASLLGIGLEYPFLKIMEILGDIFVKIAEITAHFPHSFTLIHEMPMYSLFYYTIGLIILFVFVSKIRYLGFIFLIGGIVTHAIYPKPIAVVGRNINDMVIRIDEKYYAVNEFSSEFLKTIWSGRLAQKEIPIISIDAKNKYFKNIKGGLIYIGENIDIFFVIDSFNQEICDFDDKKRKFIVDKLGGYGFDYECSDGYFVIIKNWLLAKKGAFVIR